MCEEFWLEISVNKTVEDFQTLRLDDSTAGSQATNLLVQDISPYKLNLKTMLIF